MNIKRLLCIALTVMPVISRASAPVKVAVAPASFVRPLLALPEDLYCYIILGSEQQPACCRRPNKFWWKMPENHKQAESWAWAMYDKSKAAQRLDDKLYYEIGALRSHNTMLAFECSFLAQENARLVQENAQLKAANKEEEAQKEANEVAGIFIRARKLLALKAAAPLQQNVQPPAAAASK